MDADQPDGASEMQEQLEDLKSRANAADRRASASESRADEAESRADDSATRADAAAGRTDAEDERSRDDHRRIAEIEGRVDVHDEMIAELQAEGLVSSEQAANLEIALQTARTIGAAVGIVMARYRVSEVGAFELLKKASQESNRKLRLVAADVVLTGDLPGPPPG
jgi:chromosome segregation ATPase